MPPARVGVSAEQRRALRQHARVNPELRQAQLVAWFEATYQRKIRQSTVSESLSAKFEYLNSDTVAVQNHRQRDRASLWPDLERALFAWH